eukprot:7637477-Heterocapsa_arctica.AAC.1
MQCCPHPMSLCDSCTRVLYDTHAHAHAHIHVNDGIARERRATTSEAASMNPVRTAQRSPQAEATACMH